MTDESQRSIWSHANEATDDDQATLDDVDDDADDE